MSKKVYIKPNEHVAVVGRTGSGKTWLARKYLAGYRNVVVLDTKGTFEWPEVPEEERTLVRRLADLETVQTPKIIYRPDFEELEEEYYNAFFRWSYLRRNTIVLIDEAMSVAPNPFRIPDYYKAILTRGRELDVAAWSLTQRPSGIPGVILSESTHFFVYDLNLSSDRDKMVTITGMEELSRRPGKYRFWYYKMGEDQAILARLVERREAHVG